MGKQTDAHIVSVTTEFTALKKSVTDMETALGAFAKTWNTAMQSNAPGKFQGALDADKKTYENAYSHAKTSLASAQKQLGSMDAFVTQKDKGTWNPLAKKSIGKAKKFVANAKTELGTVSKQIASPDRSGFTAHAALAIQLLASLEAKH
jgi:hypothetical protein